MGPGRGGRLVHTDLKAVGAVRRPRPLCRFTVFTTKSTREVNTKCESDPSESDTNSLRRTKTAANPALRPCGSVCPVVSIEGPAAGRAGMAFASSRARAKPFFSGTNPFLRLDKYEITHPRGGSCKTAPRRSALLSTQQ